MKNSLKLLIAALAIGGTVAGTAAYALSDRPVYANPGYANNISQVIDCGNGYKTDLDWNISHEEVVSAVPQGDNTTSAFNVEVAANFSDIVTKITCTSAQFYHKESSKVGYDSWKFGASSTAGDITFTLSKNINAIGFYAVAYANSNDSGKYLKVNDTYIDQPLIAAEPYNINSNDQRFFIELPTPTNKITIAANTDSSNRFYLYSVGFLL